MIAWIKKYRSIITLAFVGAMMLVAFPALAQGIEQVQELQISEVIKNIINAILGIIGVIAVGYLIYGGFLYLTSAGDEKQSTKARTVITSAIIGVIIIVLSWAIVRFVFQRFFGNAGIEPNINEFSTERGGGGGGLGNILNRLP